MTEGLRRDEYVGIARARVRGCTSVHSVCICLTRTRKCPRAGSNGIEGLGVLRARLRWRLLLLLLRRLAAVGHGHDVGTVLERLVEAADVTRHVLVSLDGEGNQGLPASNA